LERAILNSRAGSKTRALPEDLRIGVEAHRGAAPVLHLAELFELGLAGFAARKALPVELLVARDLDLETSDSALTTETPTPCRPPEVS
jgi:hypothetical protein